MGRSTPIADRRSPQVVLIYGSLGGKLVARTVAPFKPYAAQAILVKPDTPRAVPLPELKRIFTRLRIPHVTADSAPAAFALARRSAACNVKSAMPIL